MGAQSFAAPLRPASSGPAGIRRVARSAPPSSPGTELRGKGNPQGHSGDFPAPRSRSSRAAARAGSAAIFFRVWGLPVVLEMRSLRLRWGGGGDGVLVPLIWS